MISLGLVDHGSEVWVLLLQHHEVLLGGLELSSAAFVVCGRLLEQSQLAPVGVVARGQHGARLEVIGLGGRFYWSEAHPLIGFGGGALRGLVAFGLISLGGRVPFGRVDLLLDLRLQGLLSVRLELLVYGNFRVPFGDVELEHLRIQKLGQHGLEPALAEDGVGGDVIIMHFKPIVFQEHDFPKHVAEKGAVNDDLFDIELLGDNVLDQAASNCPRV